MVFRLLVVEDSLAARKATILRLPRDLDLDVVEAASGKEALAAYEAGRPDLVLLDLTMPEMDGFEVLERMLAMDSDAVVVVVTADTQAEVRRRCLEKGAKHVVNKPLQADALAEILRADWP